MSLRLPFDPGSFLKIWGTLSFSGRTLLHGHKEYILFLLLLISSSVQFLCQPTPFTHTHTHTHTNTHTHTHIHTHTHVHTHTHTLQLVSCSVAVTVNFRKVANLLDFEWGHLTPTWVTRRASLLCPTLFPPSPHKGRKFTQDCKFCKGVLWNQQE
jgi:hypothetical protein